MSKPRKGKVVKVKARNGTEAMSIARARYPNWVPVSAFQERVIYKPYRVRMKSRKR